MQSQKRGALQQNGALGVAMEIQGVATAARDHAHALHLEWPEKASEIITTPTVRNDGKTPGAMAQDIPVNDHSRLLLGPGDLRQVIRLRPGAALGDQARHLLQVPAEVKKGRRP